MVLRFLAAFQYNPEKAYLNLVKYYDWHAKELPITLTPRLMSLIVRGQGIVDRTREHCAFLAATSTTVR